jgi:hypothetical protein
VIAVVRYRFLPSSIVYFITMRLIVHSVALATILSVANANFACTLTGKDESSCVTSTADNGNHCVWCAVSALGFCVSESQAEAMEQAMPSVSCDRYSGNDDGSTGDDAAPASDDQAQFDDQTASDDAAPASDDKAQTDDKAKSDDQLPDDYWTCLQKKTSKDCDKDSGCVWCDTKAGFGLCMSGAFSVIKDDPYDASCVLAFLEDQSKEACEAAKDEEGNPCEYCSLQGMVDVCLTAFQAEKGSLIGITCDNAEVKDPSDINCLMAMIQSPTKDSCESVSDEDGSPCKWVSTRLWCSLLL